MKQIEPDESLFQGAVSFERGADWIMPWRLPFEKLRLFPPDDVISWTGRMAAGVRLRFSSATSKVGLEIAANDQEQLFDLTIGNELIGACRLGPGEETAVFDDLPAGEKVMELWLSQHNSVRLRRLLVDADAEIAAAPDDRPRWIAYGSSITHCEASHSPTRTWPATAARMKNLHLTCLGYSGNCHLEPMVAMIVRDLPADLITLKVGINIHGGPSLSPRTFRPALIGFVQIIREKHPDVPLAVVSPISSPPRETTDNPLGLSLTTMRAELEDAVERLRDCGDENIYYFNGLDVFGEDLAEKYLPDDLHPNADGYEVLGRNFARVVLDELPIGKTNRERTRE